jgi:hypothetical protein
MTATATKLKKSATEEMAQTRDDGDTILHDAEEILFEASDEQHKFDPGKLVTLRLAGIDVDDPNTLAREIGRVLAVKGAQAGAGTDAEMKEAQGKLADAMAAEAGQRDMLEQQIAETQQKLSGLERAHRLAKLRVEGMEAQRVRLRSAHLLPIFVRERYHRSLADVQRAVRPRIGELEDQLRRTSYVENLDAESPLAVAHCETMLPDALIRVDTPQHPHAERVGERAWRKTTVDPSRWGEYVTSLVNARPAAERELAELRARLASGIADAEILLGYYVDRL